MPGFGAYVRWTGLGVTRRQIAQISLAGPLAGWIAAAVCFLLYAQTQDPIWAALARTGAVLNILNLIPIWVLDGGQAAGVLSAVERAALLAASLGLWYYTGEGIFFFVAAGFTWRLFTKDKPQQSDLEHPGLLRRAARRACRDPSRRAEYASQSRLAQPIVRW